MQYVRLGEVIHSAKSARCGDDDYPVLSITKSEGIILQSDKFKKRIASQDTSLYKIVCRGQLVQGIHIDEANFGIQDIVDAGIVSPAYKIWDVNSDRIIPKYLEEVLRSPRSIQYYASNFNGSIKRRERLTDKDFLAMEIPCPSLEEQDYTLSVIRKMRHILFYRRKEISAMADLIKARFFEMFGDTIINQFGWEKNLLGSVCDVRDGTHNSPQYYEIGFPLVTSKNVTGGKIDLTDCSLISEEDYEKINERSKVDIGDIIMPMIGTVGKPVIVDIEPIFAIKNVALIKFRSDTRVMNTYIHTLLQSDYFDNAVFSKVRGGTQKFISLGDIRKLEVLVPPMDRQEQFAEFVKQVDKSKVAIQATLDKEKLLFDCLMQEYFG